LREARTVRADLVSRVARGERAAPSKLTFGDYASTWLDTQSHLRPPPRRWYDVVIRLHLTPRLGRHKLTAISEDDVARLISEMSGQAIVAATSSEIRLQATCGRRVSASPRTRSSTSSEVGDRTSGAERRKVSA
jgi:hypothetical protein